MGIISVDVLLALFFISSHPHIIDSLFAINIFFVDSIIFNVGLSPAIPGIAEIVNSDFSLICRNQIIFYLNFIIFKFFYLLINIFITYYKNLRFIFSNLFTNKLKFLFAENK